MKILKFEGFILNKLSLKDADRLLTIFTKEQGKIVCYARGVRNITSSRISKLDLFSHIKFEVIQNKDRLTLTNVDLINSHSINKKDLNNISRLFEIGELVDGLLPENEVNKEIYYLLNKALLNLTRFDIPEYMRRFKLRVLSELGYGSKDLGVNELDDYIESILEKPLLTKKIL